MSKKKQDLQLSITKWTDIENDFYLRLLNLCLSVYEWKGLPSTVDPRYLELILNTRGFAVFFQDPILKEYYALMSTYQGNFDIYHTPKDRRAYAVNGYNIELNEKNSVLIFNNFTRTNNVNTLRKFASRLTTVQMTIDINVNAQKTPFLLMCEEEQQLSIRNLYSQYAGGEDFIITKKTFDMDSFQVLSTKADFIADKLQILKKQIWDEALNFIGIETSNTEKRERLITDEVTSNLGYVEAERYVMLNARREACKMINTMYKLNLSVDFRSNTTMIDTTENGQAQSPQV